MQTPMLHAKVTCFILSGSLCMACGGAPSVDFWSEAGAPAVPASTAGAPSGGSGESPLSSAGSVASGGAPSAGAAPSLPGAGSPAGGAGGAGGALVTGEATVTMRSLVDDVEAPVSTILEADGREGFWYTFNDGKSGTQLPAPNGPFLPDATSGGYPGSAHAKHTHGSAFTSYAGFGFDLNNHTGQRQVYDASAFSGIVLWTRGNVSLRALFPTRATAPASEGGVCTSDCDDSFGLDLSVTEQWTEQTIPFASLRQLTNSDVSFDPKALLGIAFSVPPGGDFDIWVDEIGFY